MGTEQFLVWILRGLAAVFALFGALFFLSPDGVLERTAEIGSWFGKFADPPKSDQKLWLALGVSYMTVVAGIALLVAQNVRRYWPTLYVLAAGKATSSLAAGFFYFTNSQVFAYLLNFLVDASLTMLVLYIAALAKRAANPQTL